MNMRFFPMPCGLRALVVAVLVCGASSVSAGGPHLHGPLPDSDPHRCAGCAAGLCTPNSKFGYYRPIWRRWPGASTYLGIGGPKPAVGTPSLEAPDALDEARFEARTRSEEPAASSAVEPPSTATEADPFISVPEEEAPISGESEPSTPEPSFPPFGGFGDPAEVPAPGLNADPIFNPGGEIDNTPNNPAPETDFPNLDFPPLDNPPPSNDLDLGMLDQKLQEQLGLGHDSTPNSLNSPRISSSADDVPIELPLGLTADDERAVATSSGELSVEQVTYEVPVRELEIFDAEDAYVKNPLRGKLRREARNGPTEVAATSDVDGTELTSPQDAAPQPPSRVAPHSESAAQPQRHAKLVGGMNRDLRETLRKNPLR